MKPKLDGLNKIFKDAYGEKITEMVKNLKFNNIKKPAPPRVMRTVKINEGVWDVRISNELTFSMGVVDVGIVYGDDVEGKVFDEKIFVDAATARFKYDVSGPATLCIRPSSAANILTQVIDYGGATINVIVIRVTEK